MTCTRPAPAKCDLCGEPMGHEVGPTHRRCWLLEEYLADQIPGRDADQQD